MKNVTRTGARTLKAVALALGLFFLTGMTAVLHAQPNAWINEFHYDNAGTDVNEFVEIVIENPGSYNLADFALYLYNGATAANGVTYGGTPRLLSDFTVGAVVGNFTFYYTVYPQDGIQNGDRDGFALTYQGNVIPGQLLSYEGVFTAGNGPAIGMTSVDVGVSQTNSTPIGLTLQLAGAGTQYANFYWEGPVNVTIGQPNYNQFIGQIVYCGDILSFSFPQESSPAVIDSANAEVYIEVLAGTNLTNLVATFGMCYFSMAFDMTNQSFNEVISGVTALDYSDTIYWQVIFGDESGYRIWRIVVKESQVQLPSIVINEVDYDQPGLDNAEFIELKNTGSQAVDLLGMRVDLVNGGTNPPATYRSITLPSYMLGPGEYYVICGDGGNVPNCNFVVTGVMNDLIQNGAPDAIALFSAGGVRLDALSYEGNTPGFTEGSGVGLIDAGNAPMLGLSRWPDGVDTDDNSADFRLLCITPGAPNVLDEGPCICTVFEIVVDTIYDCDLVTNSYGGELTITYTKAPATGYLLVNGDQFPIQTSPQTVQLSGWPANGLPVDVTVAFSEDLGCTLTETELFIAPASCGACAFDSVRVVEISPCDPVTNTYGVECAFYVDNYMSDSIGVQIGTITRVLKHHTPTKNGAYPDFYVFIDDLVADGLPVSVLFFNPADPGCALFVTDLWTAPANCYQAPAIVINEVDYDQPGVDHAEFIELKNTSPYPVNLLNWKVILVNGGVNPPDIYRTITLPDYELGVGEYYVICGNASNVPNCNFVVSGAATNLIQNGNPDALALLDPYGGMVDALSYGGNTPGYTEGSGVGLTDNASFANHGISRFPDGADTDVNNVDFLFTCITPGEPNTNLVGYCGPFHYLEATVYYDNDLATPMQFIEISLYRDGAFVETQTTDNQGKVQFSDLRNGTHTFVVDPGAYDWGWGGVNSLDALMIAKHFAGMITLSPFSQAVGDVATPAGLNSTDAMTVAQRFAGLIADFTVGDWYTTQPPLVISGTEDQFFTLQMPIRCYGDVNGSYIPPIKASALSLQQEGILTLQEGQLQLPISLDHSAQLGAVSLLITLPENARAVDVRMMNQEQAIFKQEGQMLKIAWFSLDGIMASARETFLTMVLEVHRDADFKQLQVLPGSSLGDVDGIELKHVGLIMPHVSTGETLLKTYPNPVSHSLHVDIQLSTAQYVTLGVYNLLGEMVAGMDLGNRDAGIHQVQLDVSKLSKGSYLIRLDGIVESTTSRITVVR